MTEKHLCIGITGERDWQDGDAVIGALDDLLVEFPGYVTTLFVGDCKTGADHFAREWWFSRYTEASAVFGSEVATRTDAQGNRILIFWADWEQDKKAAGPLRNDRLATALDEANGIKRTVAFWSGKRSGSGTLDAFSRFASLGIDVRVIARKP